MKENKTTVNSGVGFASLLTIVFIVLKLLGKITWSWWWVLSPILVEIAVVLLILAFMLILAVIKAVRE